MCMWVKKNHSDQESAIEGKEQGTLLGIFPLVLSWYRFYALQAIGDQAVHFVALSDIKIPIA